MCLSRLPIQYMPDLRGNTHVIEMMPDGQCVLLTVPTEDSVASHIQLDVLRGAPFVEVRYINKVVRYAPIERPQLLRNPRTAAQGHNCKQYCKPISEKAGMAVEMKGNRLHDILRTVQGIPEYRGR